MESKIIINVSIILISGLIFGRLGKFLKLPNVTGYLIAGLLLGPSVFNILNEGMTSDFEVISNIALGFIAFSIGCEFSIDYFKKVGMAPVIIAIAEAFGAIIFVSCTLILLKFDMKLSIMLGAIAAATAPAQTVMVINQYNCKGPLTSMLLSVAAIDDAVALIGFGIATACVKMMSSNNGINISGLLNPFYTVIISLVIGCAAALIMKLFFKWFKKSSNRICVITGIILCTYWLSDKVHGSSLLSCMALGAVLANIFEETDGLAKITSSFTPPIFMMFFVISGAGFDISALKSIGIIGIMYVIMRVVGKILGAWLGGKITKQEEKICKWLGPTLMPQAGVALGLIIAAGSLVPNYAPLIKTAILCSTFIYSLIGPAVAKYSLIKAGEITAEKQKAS